MTGSDHIRTISRIKNVAMVNVSYGDLSARIYYLMSRFPVAVSITQCVTFQWYKVAYTKYTRPSRSRGRGLASPDYLCSALNVCGESRAWNANHVRLLAWECAGTFVYYNVFGNGRQIISIPSA